YLSRLIIQTADTNNWFILAGVMLFSSFYLFSNALLAQRGKYKFKILD
ncbi:hypothetical protein HMPREF1370_01988, partial [Enterococcus faecium P1123]